MSAPGEHAEEIRQPLGRWRFATSVVDEQRAAVSVGGTPVELDRSCYDVLLTLLRHAGEVVTKDELLEAGWPGRVVSENSLAKTVSRLRQALGADGEAIRVVHGYGYRLTAVVRHEASVQDRISTSSSHFLALQAGDALPLRPGWRLGQPLGEGGAGLIYLAVSTGGAQVAVKFANSEIGLSGLKREIALHRYIMASTGGLRNVAPLLSWNLTQTPYFLEVPYYADGNLHDWAGTRGGLDSLPLAERIAMCAELCETVARLHELGVLHKDLKPANLYPVSDANGTHLVLADLGVAEATTALQMAGLGLTFSLPLNADGSSSPVGSMLYVAPEVIAGEVGTQHSDVYSLGVILFQICVGDLRGSLAPGWEQRIEDSLLREDIAAAAALRSEQRPDARGLCVRLRELPVRRLARAAQLQQDANLERQAKALVAAQQRRRLLLTLSGGLALGLVGSLLMYWQADVARKQAQKTSSEKQAIVDFLANDLLAQADPYKTNRSDITLRAAIDSAAGKVDRNFTNQPDVALALHKTIANVYEGLGLYQLASDQLRHAQNDYAKSSEQIPHISADLSISLCSTLRSAGDFENAALACEAGNQILRTLGESSDSANLITGKLLFEQGRCKEALPEFESVQSSPTSSNTADARRMRELISDASYFSALCLQELGRTPAAQDKFVQTIQIRRERFGAKSPYLAWVLSDYGNFLVEQGQFVQAGVALEESRDIFANSLGEDDPERYVPDVGFALIRLYAHDWPSAIKLLGPLHAVKEKTLGATHLWTLKTLSTLAWAKSEVGSEEEAAKDLDTAMALAQPKFEAFGTRASFLVDQWIRTSLALGRDDLVRSLIKQQQGLVSALEPHHMRAAMLPCYWAELLRHDPASAQASVVQLENQCRNELLIGLPADHPLVKDVDAMLAGATGKVRRSPGRP
jgi:non-specific serine/threonine protein kinase